MINPRICTGKLPAWASPTSLQWLIISKASTRTPQQQTVRLAAEAGLAEISIENTALPDETPYDFDLAVERIHAAASAVRALRRDFMLIARADGVMLEQYGLEEALRRIRAFDAAGADGLYVPVPGGPEALSQICRARRPVRQPRADRPCPDNHRLHSGPSEEGDEHASRRPAAFVETRGRLDA